MARSDPDVNSRAGRFLGWVDGHPRTGWYISFIVTLDLFFEIFAVFQK